MLASRPSNDSPDALELELAPIWDSNGLAGYQLSTTGEATFSADVPDGLAREDLGTRMNIKLVGRDFVFGRHQTHTKWKDARKLVALERLRFYRATPANKSATPPRVPKEASLNELQKSPLALRLGLVLHQDETKLVLIAVSGVSALLNNGSQVTDPDDVVLVSTIPMVATDGAEVAIYLSGTSAAAEERDDCLKAFF